MNIKEVEEFLSGLIFGLTQKDDLPEIQKCLTDGTELQHDITEMFEDFEKKDLSGIIAGVKMAVKVLHESESDLKDCKGMQDDIAKIHELLSVFDNRIVFEETIYLNLLRNYQQIFGDIEKSITDVGNSDFKAFGGDVVDLMVETLTPVDTQPENLEITQW